MTGKSAINARFDYAQYLIREAGDLAHNYFKNRSSLTVKSKGLQDVVSEADLNTELLIRNGLAKQFPEDAFLGEETGISDHAPDQGIWVVDPIDGTQPFVSGMANWCVSIAFVKSGIIQFGLVYAPVRGELFLGGLDHPATLNGEAIHGHSGASIKDGLVGAGYSTRVSAEKFLPIFGEFLKQGGMFYRDGSGALMLCDVACGRLIGYAELHINSWDCLGAIAVIQAAGLKTNDFLANDGLNKGNLILAANGEAVYRQLEDLFAPQ